MARLPVRMTATTPLALVLVLLAVMAWPSGAMAQQELLDEASLAIKARDLPRARALLDEALLHPNLSRVAFNAARLQRATVLVSLGDIEAAYVDADAVIRNDPCSAKASVVMSFAALQAGDHALALDHAGRAARLNPELREAYRVQAEALRLAGRPAAAAVADLRAQAHPIENDTARSADAWCALAVRDVSGARVAFERIVAQGEPTDESAAAYYLLNSYNDPEVMYRSLEEIAVRAPETLASLWLALLSQPADRRLLLEERIRADPTDLAAGLSLVDGLIGSGEDPFVAWRELLDGEPLDGLTRAVLELADRRPLDADQAAALHAETLAGRDRDFAPVHYFAASLVLGSEGYAELSGELRKMVIFAKLGYGDGVVLIVAVTGWREEM